MKQLNLIASTLLIVGGLSWGLVGLARFDLVPAIYCDVSFPSNVAYSAVGIAALFQLGRIFTPNLTLTYAQTR